MKKLTTAILLPLVFGQLGAEEPDNPSLQQRFDATIAPLVRSHCVKCHGAKAHEGEVALHDIGIDPSNGKSVALWSRVLEQLETGAMPPADEPQPSAVQREQMVGWIKGTLIAAGNESGLKISLLAIYLSTEAVYRMELGRGEPDEFGRRMLSPQEVVLAIAYAFGDSPPADIPILRDALRNDLLTNKKNIALAELMA